jgi:hypothetical protein
MADTGTGQDTSPVRMFQVTAPKNPQLQAIAERVARKVQLAVEKATGHHAEPGNFPMPAERGSLEALFLAHIQQQTPERQHRIVNRILPRLRAPAEQRKSRYAELDQVDLHSPKPIVDQVDRVPLRTPVQFTHQELAAAIGQEGAEFVGTDSLPAIPEK